MARTDDVLEILKAHAPTPMTAREVYAKSDTFGDVAEVCWAMNTLSKSKKIIPHGRKPSPHGGPDRVAYRVATPEERTASATKHPAHQLAEPPDDVSTPSPAAPAPAPKPTPRRPCGCAAQTEIARLRAENERMRDELAAVTAERDEARAELARALRDRDNALELAAQVCVDEVNRNMDEYTRLPQNFSRRVIYAAMGVAATNCRDGIREIIDSRSNNEAGR